MVKADSGLTKCFAGFLKCSKFLLLVMLNTIGKLYQHILNENMKKRKKRTIRYNSMLRNASPCDALSLNKT